MRIILLILISILTSQFVAMSQEKIYRQLEKEQLTDANVVLKEKISFNVKYSDELGFAAFDKNGDFLFEVFPYDNGPDYPSEGLIRIKENGKIGYANLDGKIVIPPKFECAFPFQHGVALICTEGTLVKDGEHCTWANAKWGAIDKEGEIIVEPFDIGLFTLDILELKISLHQKFPGQFKVKTRLAKPDQIDFFVNGKEGGLFVDIYSTLTGKQLMVYLFLPWQDLFKKPSSVHDVMISPEQLVTVTQKYIIYQVYGAPLLSEEEMDDIRNLTEWMRKLLGYVEAQQLIRKQDGVTSPEGLQIISLNEYPNYLEVSVAIPGSGLISPDIVRKEFPSKMVLLHQIPDIGGVKSSWITPKAKEDNSETIDSTSTFQFSESKIIPDETNTFPDYASKLTPDNMLDFMPSLLEDLAKISVANVDNLATLLEAYDDYLKKVFKNPGEWIDGNIILGGREREYKPTADELILNEVGDRIITIVSETEPKILEDVFKQIGKYPKEIEFIRFSFTHYDVMGSGRFFYVDSMEKIEFKLPK